MRGYEDGLYVTVILRMFTVLSCVIIEPSREMEKSRGILGKKVLDAYKFTRLRLPFCEAQYIFEFTDITVARQDVGRAKEDEADFKGVDECSVESSVYE